MGDKTSKGVALITGASSGIGAVYADRLAKRGYDLILAARDESRLNTLATRLRAEVGVKVDVIRADLLVGDDVRRLETRLREDTGVTVLVNNAGAARLTPFAETDPDGWDNLIELNITAFTRLASGAAAGFKQRGRGAIINISSVAALVPQAISSVYGATKAYVLHLSQALSEDLASSGVTVQAVLPGPTRTEIWERSGFGIENVPDEMMMDVEEMVDAALVGLDQGEVVTIPTLPDAGDWAAVAAARGKLAPHFAGKHPAARYGVKVAEPA